MHKKTKIVGILNITPDSFSDGGLEGDNNAIIQTAQKLIADGADVIDIGAESTRPGATPLTHVEEWRRLNAILPQLCNLAASNGILTSIDTRHAATAKLAIQSGINWVNDVSGTQDIDMIKVLSNWSGKIVIMHNLGVPADKNITISASQDPIAEVTEFLFSRIKALNNYGILSDRIIIDPGIGFGKTPEQSWQLISHISVLHELNTEILVGHSRKSFLDIYTGKKLSTTEERDTATLDVSKQLAASEVDYLRVHNVALHKKFLI